MQMQPLLEQEVAEEEEESSEKEIILMDIRVNVTSNQLIAAAVG